MANNLATKLTENATSLDWLGLALLLSGVFFGIVFLLRSKPIEYILINGEAPWPVLNTKSWVETSARIISTRFLSRSGNLMILLGGYHAELHKPLTATVEFKTDKGNHASADVILLATSFRENDVITIRYNPKRLDRVIQVRPLN